MNKIEKLILDFEKFLKDEYGYNGTFTENIKMSHGICCCCSSCGQYHDDCVCESNRIYQFIKDLKKKYVKNNNI